MRKLPIIFLFSITLITSFLSYQLLSQEPLVYNCGIATGFPPYQYINKKGQRAGLDVEIAELVFKTAGLKVNFLQDDWEKLLFNLFHKRKGIDMLCGAEVTIERQRHLDFSLPYFNRRTVLFTLKDSPVNKVGDLYGKIVTGDLHSSFEQKLGDKKKYIRVTKTVSKEESFTKLKEKKVVAVIAPMEVGIYLAKELGVEVKIIDENDVGTPVSIAVKKGDGKLLNTINTTLAKLIKSGQINKILKKYQKR